MTARRGLVITRDHQHIFRTCGRGRAVRLYTYGSVLITCLHPGCAQCTKYAARCLATWCSCRALVPNCPMALFCGLAVRISTQLAWVYACVREVRSSTQLGWVYACGRGIEGSNLPNRGARCPCSPQLQPAHRLNVFLVIALGHVWWFLPLHTCPRHTSNS